MPFFIRYASVTTSFPQSHLQRHIVRLPLFGARSIATSRPNRWPLKSMNLIWIASRITLAKKVRAAAQARTGFSGASLAACVAMSAAQQRGFAERQRGRINALRPGQHGATGALGALVAGHDAGKIGRLRVRAVELALGLVLLLLGDRLGRALRLLLRVGLLL